MTSEQDKQSRDEFLVEAQELVESASRDLLLLEQAIKHSEPSTELVSDLFRGVHTLKGLAGMFGFTGVGRLAHALEDLLDHVRMGRLDLGVDVMDVLFEGVQGFQGLLGYAGTSRDELDLDRFTARVAALASSAVTKQNVLEHYAFDSETLAALTEYEEYRLRSHLERGDHVCVFHVELGLDSLEQDLDRLKEQVSTVAEVVALLPASGEASKDRIAFEVLIATRVSLLELREVLAPFGSAVEAVGRRSIPPPPAAPQAKPSASPRPGPALRPAGASPLAMRAPSSVVRVEIRKLDHLMNVVGELAGARAAFARLLERIRTRGLDHELLLDAQRLHRRLGRNLSDVQDAVLHVRMVPLSQLFDRLAVVVRQLAREQDKDVQLHVQGASTEVDKLIAEEIADPLVHIVRNAIDHGIEDRGERMKQGKTAFGTLRVHAYPRGNQVVIEVSDDGRGIDSEAVKRAAVERGLLSRAGAQELSPADLVELLFVPGFSTRSSVSDISGRGVGMDVVRTNVQRLGGAVEVRSQPAAGASVVLTMPITLAILSALIFVSRARRFCVPVSSVQEVLRLDPEAVRKIDGREVLDLRGASLPLCRLGQLLCLDAMKVGASDQHVIVVSVANRQLGLVVDRIHGQQDIIVKPLGASLRDVRGFSGAADLGDQRLLLVLDAAAIVDEVLSTRAARLGTGAEA
jgi:two-component system chemotaxis sensor kinase CheA